MLYYNLILNLIFLLIFKINSSFTSDSISNHSLKLDINNKQELKQVTINSIQNLLKYYTPTPTGVFDEAQIPWWTSAVIWGSLFDYARWSKDEQFVNISTEALTNMSYGKEHDFLGGDLINSTAKIAERWNDDILWASQSQTHFFFLVVSGAKLFGPNSTMGNSGGSWISLATKTFDQAAEQIDNKCGGGVYWYRNRNTKAGTYKAVITQLEFISQGATTYILTKNETILSQSKEILDWVLTSGISNPKTGLILDGVSTTNCSDYTELLWTYSYGQLIGALAWMHKATKLQKYLDMAIPFLDFAIKTFAGPERSGVITELCEDDQNCHRDQHAFKGIFSLNLVYLYKFTNDLQVKTEISNLIFTSVNSMVSHSCDLDWNCNGNWNSDSRDGKFKKDLPSQQVSTALLISAVGIRFHQDSSHHHHHHHETNPQIRSP